MKKAFLIAFITLFSMQPVRPFFKAAALAGMGALAVVAYYNKDEIKTYAYGAYLKYWRLPYLKEDIAECLRRGNALSDYSKDTIKMAIKMSPDFLALWLKDKLTPDQITQVVAIFKQFLNPQDLLVLTQRVLQNTADGVRNKICTAAGKVQGKLQKRWNALFGN